MLLENARSGSATAAETEIERRSPGTAGVPARPGVGDRCGRGRPRSQAGRLRANAPVVWRRRADFAAVLMLPVLTLATTWDLLGDRPIAGLDSLTQFYPWYAFLGESLRAGQVPGWNPHLFSGAPFAADPLSGWTYLPAMLLFGLLPLPTAIAAYLFVHPLLAALFTYALARVLRLGTAGALLSATAYGSSGFLSAHNPCCFAFASVATWLPLAILGAELAIRSRCHVRRALWWGVAGFAQSQILAAWLGQGSYYALLALGGYLAYRTLVAPPSAVDFRHRVGALAVNGGGVLLFGFGLAAAGLLPRLEYNALSNLAGGYRPDDLAVGGWSVPEWDQLVMPSVWYAGATVVILALAAPLVAREWPATPYFIGLSLGALLLTAHWPTSSHWLLSLLPRFAELHPHLPERIMTVGYLGLALLAGATLTVLPRGRSSPLWTALLIAIVFVDLLVANRIVTAHALALADVGQVDKLQRVDVTAYYEPSGAGAFLRSEGGLFRYFGYAPEIGALAYTQRFADPLTRALEVNNRAMASGLHDVQGYNAIHVGRYDEYLAALNGRDQNYHNAEVFGAGLGSPLLDLLNARYIVVPRLTPTNRAELESLDLPRLERTYPVVYRDDRVQVLENPEALPRAWIVHAARQVGAGEALDLLSSGAVDPRQTALLEQAPPDLAEPDDRSADRVSITGYEADRILARATTDAAGLLVLSEVYYPSWRAYVDAQPVPVYVANHVLRAIPLPAGEHSVELRYESPALELGLMISASMYLILAALAIVAWTRPAEIAAAPPPLLAPPRTASVGPPVVVTGDLASPRGIAFGPAGEIYVADSGAASQPGSGRLLRIMADGSAAPILVGAANLTAAPHGETYIYGLSDVAVQADSLLFTVGFGATGNGALGVPNRLLRLGPTGALSPVFDFDRVEQERDPDGRGAGSNATGIAPAPDSAVWISDAGGNWVARLTGDGSLLGLVVFPAVDGEEAVPTGLAIGPDGQAYVSLFRCLVPTGGKGGVARVTADGSYEIVASGLSKPIDVAFGLDGALHVLEFAVDYAPASGRLLRVAEDGRADVLANGLSYPTSLAIDSAGRIYVTEMAGVAGGPPASGRLVRFDPGG